MRWSWCAFGALGAAACSSTADDGGGAAKSTTSDASTQPAATGGGPSASAGGGGQSTATGGGQSVSTGGASSVSTGGAAAGLDARAPDTGGSPPTDASVGSDAAFGQPPPYCVPPCIWNAIAACNLPAPAACLEEKVNPLGGPPGTYPEQTKRCIPGTGWTYAEGPVATRTSRFTIRKDGTQCFSMELSVDPGTQYLTYSDALGHAIAVQVLNAVVCAEGAAMTMLLDLCTAANPCDLANPAPTMFDALPAGATGYVLRSSEPECAAWKPPYAALPCSSVTTGACHDAGAP